MALSRLGLARTFQHPALQLHATVLENVMLGAHPRLRGGPVSWSLRLPPTGQDERSPARRGAASCSTASGSGWAATAHADEMSHGLHKGIELCRAMLLEADDCCCWTSRRRACRTPRSTASSRRCERMRADFDITIVIVEHHMGLISALTDRVVVLDHGRKLMEGTAAEAQADARVIEAYIGKDAADDAA